MSKSLCIFINLAKAFDNVFHDKHKGKITIHKQEPKYPTRYHQKHLRLRGVKIIGQRNCLHLAPRIFNV